MSLVPPPTPSTAVRKVQPETAPALKTDKPQADNPVHKPVHGQSQSGQPYKADHQFVTGDLLGKDMSNFDILLFFLFCLIPATRMSLSRLLVCFAGAQVKL